MSEYRKNKLFLENVHLKSKKRDLTIQFFLANLFSTVFMWSFHDIWFSKITPKNFIEDVFSMFLLSIFKSGILDISFLDFLWKNVYLVFSMFNDHLLALNHWLIHSNSEFAVGKRSFMF